jgi:hypothetical protein
MDPGELCNGLPGNIIDISLTRLPLNFELCAWTELSKIGSSPVLLRGTLF